MTRNKYRAKPTVVDGIRFDSLLESRRYQELKLLERAGAIKDLRVHTRWPLCNRYGQVVGEYESDFDYLTNGRVVEDVKGCDTPMSKWKRRHFALDYGITVSVVRKVRTRRAA